MNATYLYKWNTVIVHFLHFVLLLDVYIYSLESEEIQWRDIGDEGALALADPRVFKNFKTLK